MLGSGGGELGAGTHSWLGSSRCWSGSRERLSKLCGLCCVFFLSVSLLFLFPLFAVLLNCPYPEPPVSACFFPFSSTPQWWKGRPHGSFVASCSQTITISQYTYTYASILIAYQNQFREIISIL